jgi:hypothetical protein
MIEMIALPDRRFSAVDPGLRGEYPARALRVLHVLLLWSVGALFVGALGSDDRAVAVYAVVFDGG